MASILSRFFKSSPPEGDRETLKTFKKRYASFRRLLDANAALADLMADMEEKLRGTSLFGFLYIKNVARLSVYHTRRMIKSLNDIVPGRHNGLTEVVDAIETSLISLIGSQLDERETDPAISTIPLDSIDLSLSGWVGGKAANLGDMLTMVGAPVPKGFAITIAGFHRFMAHLNLGADILKMLSSANPEDGEDFSQILARIRERVENAPLPPALEEEMKLVWKKALADENVLAAVRSSALSEDTENSFAGQFITILGVTYDNFIESYRKVVASLFTSSATFYRLHQGVALEDSAMCVVVVEMIHAHAGGVAYSHDPASIANETLIINAVLGLGTLLVDGTAPPDTYIFSREDSPSLIRKKKGQQILKATLLDGGGLETSPLNESERKQYALTDEQATELAVLILQLERHFGGYQDVEWALDEEGTIIILQSRPLIVRTFLANLPAMPVPRNNPLLADSGDVAYAGIGAGTIVKPESEEELASFPDGGILVARHSSPMYAQIMAKAQAIITETGGVTGHMATLVREFHVPAILNVKGAMKSFRAGQTVTVDSFSCKIYDGIAEELLPFQAQFEQVQLVNTPVHIALREEAKNILPLHLTDPSASNFTPSGCKTLHDIMRYAHESSYQAMFNISDSAAKAEGVAKKLAFHLPIDLYIIDIDNGSNAPASSRSIMLEQIVCRPLTALLRGMTHPDVRFRRPRHVNMGGFMSVMSQQIANPAGGDNRFGEKSYAIISDRYMNFSSRVGYHYSVLDAYCGKSVSKNYISFSFQGGAAGEERRVRRCRAIALVLDELGFTVKMQGDSVKSRIQKYEAGIIEDKLDQLGRLLQVTRQMDMLMINEAAIVQFRDDFMKGVYR